MAKRQLPIETQVGSIQPSVAKKRDNQIVRTTYTSEGINRWISDEIPLNGFGSKKNLKIALCGTFENDVMVTGLISTLAVDIPVRQCWLFGDRIYARVFSEKYKFHDAWFDLSLKPIFNTLVHIEYHDGSSFHGYILDTVTRVGYVTNASGDNMISGTFKNGLLLDGQGFMIRNGEMARGVFEEGKFVSGSYTTKNGTILTGIFTDNKLHGFGIVTLPDGTIIKGEFVNGEITGTLSFGVDGQVVFK